LANLAVMFNVMMIYYTKPMIFLKYLAKHFTDVHDLTFLVLYSLVKNGLTLLTELIRIYIFVYFSFVALYSLPVLILIKYSYLPSLMLLGGSNWRRTLVCKEHAVHNPDIWGSKNKFLSNVANVAPLTGLYKCLVTLLNKTRIN